jgi:hypothetical protein
MQSTLCRALILFKAIIAALILTSCTSGDSSDMKESVAPPAVSESSVAPAASETEAEGLRKCGAPPAPIVCCEAMIPACNECRDKSRRAIEEWRQRCAPKPAAQPPTTPEHCKQEPDTDCCSDSTPECRSCREKALNELMAWRLSCGKTQSFDCRVKPSADQCCSTSEPSCDACRKRIQRLLDEFRKHCQ